MPGNGFSLQVGLYDGDPAGANRPGQDPEAQRLDRTGTNFRLNDPALLIAEATYAYNIAPGSKGLPATSPSAGWHHGGRFDSLRFEHHRRAAGDPKRHGDRPAGARQCRALRHLRSDPLSESGRDDEGLGFFVRAAWSPTRST